MSKAITKKQILQDKQYDAVNITMDVLLKEMIKKLKYMESSYLENPQAFHGRQLPDKRKLEKFEVVLEHLFGIYGIYFMIDNNYPGPIQIKKSRATNLINKLKALC